MSADQHGGVAADRSHGLFRHRTAPIEAHGSPTYSQEKPFFLPTMYPDRATVSRGDILVTERSRLLAVRDIQGDTCTVEGLCPDDTTVEKRPVSDLNLQINTGRGQIIAADCTDRQHRWWITGRQPEGPPIDTGALSFQRADSVTRVNKFLNHPLVDHQLGDRAVSKAAFTVTAGSTDSIVAVAVLQPPARLANDYQQITLSRFASHPAAPDNTASWTLSRLCTWAKVHGYRTMRTHAGVANGNTGTIYEAANFTFLQESEASGDGYANRAGRSNRDAFTRRTYYRHLDTENIRVPPPDIDDSVPVTVPAKHETPRAAPTAESMPSLSVYLATETAGQSTTLSDFSANDAAVAADARNHHHSGYLQPAAHSIVDFERNTALADALANRLGAAERSAGVPTKVASSQQSVLPQDAPTPAVTIGAHNAGTLSTIVVAHHESDVESLNDEPSNARSGDYVVTGFATAMADGWTNVASSLLATLRTRAELAERAVTIASDLSIVTPAAKQTGLKTVAITSSDTASVQTTLDLA